MAARSKSRFWRLCRLYFRRFRIAAWLAILVILGCLLYLNQIGLPGFLKRPLLEKLHARGLDLGFSRLRWRWYQGIVAENVRFGRADDPQSPRLTAVELQVRLKLKALARLQVQLDSVQMRRGRLLLPVPDPGRTARELSVSNIESELRFLPGDQWALDNFKAEFAGANIRLAGVITNASMVRDWKVFQASQPVSTTAGEWEARLRRFADTLERIHCSVPPTAHLEVEGDAREVQTFTVRMAISAPAADTPWGSLSQGRFTGRIFPADTNGLSRGEILLEASDAQTPWGAVTNLNLSVQLSSAAGLTNLVDGDLHLTADQVQTLWAGGTNTVITAHWVHSMTNPVPLSGHGQFECEFAQTPYGTARKAHVAGDLARSVAIELPAGTALAWDWWTNLQPYSLAWECRLLDLHSPDIDLEELVAGGTWTAPELGLTNLTGKLHGAALEIQGSLDVSTRQVKATLSSAIDPHRISLLLPPDARQWLERFTWDAPPRLQAEAAFLMPPWTNHHPDWPASIQPSLQLQGEAVLERGGAFRSVTFTAAYARFIYTNLCWNLPELMLSRAEGGVWTSLFANQRTRQYQLQLRSTLDPQLLQPLLGPSERTALDLVAFTQPPVLTAEIWGSDDPAQMGFRGQLAVTNFSFRGEAASGLQAEFQYTNQVLEVFSPRIQFGEREARADGLAADFNAGLIYLTNGFSTAEPMVIARAIGPQIARAIAPYQFGRPPTAHVQGAIPMRGEEGADLYFDLEGGPFHWWKFNLSQLAGRVHWSGEKLSLNVSRASFYQGASAGSAIFNFKTNGNAEFQASFATTNTLLQSLMADLSPRTNNLEGWLSGNLVITHGDTENWQSVLGYGELQLRDGLVWDIPLFGIFTPVLNGVAPNLGNSRATGASCSYYITNGIVFSDDLEIRSAAMRLQYRGTIDLEGRLNARVDAELLRNVWFVGPLVSTVLWPVTKMFEYKVGGTVDDPRTEPVYILPKIVLMPLHPLRTLKGLFPEEPGAPPSAPPVK